jgi:hypothetical protein
MTVKIVEALIKTQIEKPKLVLRFQNKFLIKGEIQDQ